MLNPLKGLGDLNQLRKQAQEMQKVLAQEEIVVDKDGVRIEMTADQKIQKVEIDGHEEKRVAKAFEDALKQIQQVMAKSLMSMQS